MTRPPILRLSYDDEINVDLFAGGGGASVGIQAAGIPVHVAINHDPVALADAELAQVGELKALLEEMAR